MPSEFRTVLAAGMDYCYRRRCFLSSSSTNVASQIHCCTDKQAFWAEMETTALSIIARPRDASTYFPSTCPGEHAVLIFQVLLVFASCVLRSFGRLAHPNPRAVRTWILARPTLGYAGSLMFQIFATLHMCTTKCYASETHGRWDTRRLLRPLYICSALLEK